MNFFLNFSLFHYVKLSASFQEITAVLFQDIHADCHSQHTVRWDRVTCWQKDVIFQ